jgi:hypothetical protein
MTLVAAIHAPCFLPDADRLAPAQIYEFNRLARMACPILIGIGVWIAGAVLWAKGGDPSRVLTGQLMLAGGLAVSTLAQMYAQGMGNDARRALVLLATQVAFVAMIAGAIFWRHAVSPERLVLGQALTLGGLLGFSALAMCHGSLSVQQTPHPAQIGMGLLFATWIAGAILIAQAPQASYILAGKAMLGTALPLWAIAGCISCSVADQAHHRDWERQQRRVVQFDIHGLPDNWRTLINQRHHLDHTQSDAIRLDETPAQAASRLQRAIRNELRPDLLLQRDAAIADLKGLVASLRPGEATRAGRKGLLQIPALGQQPERSIWGGQKTAVDVAREYRSRNVYVADAPRDPALLALLKDANSDRQLRQSLSLSLNGVERSALLRIDQWEESPVRRVMELLLSPRQENATTVESNIRHLEALLADRSWHGDQAFNAGVAALVIRHCFWNLAPHRTDTAFVQSAGQLLAGWSRAHLSHLNRDQLTRWLTPLFIAMKAHAEVATKTDQVPVAIRQMMLAAAWAGSCINMGAGTGPLSQIGTIWNAAGVPVTAPTAAPKAEAAQPAAAAR